MEGNCHQTSCTHYQVIIKCYSDVTLFLQFRIKCFTFSDVILLSSKYNFFYTESENYLVSQYEI